MLHDSKYATLNTQKQLPNMREIELLMLARQD